MLALDFDGTMTDAELEGEPFTRVELDAMLELASQGIRSLVEAQKSALAA